MTEMSRLPFPCYKIIEGANLSLPWAVNYISRFKVGRKESIPFQAF